MASPKPYALTEFSASISFMAQALSHPARITILKILADRGPTHATVFHNIIPLSQPTVSHHLKSLKEGHFIIAEVRGKYVIYHLNVKNFELMKCCFDQLFGAEISPRIPIEEDFYRIGLPLR